MTVEQLHYDYRLKLDKVDSLQERSFNEAQIDWILNEAQLVFIKTNYGLNNKFRIGFEKTEHRIQDLKNLHIKSPFPQTSLVPVQLSDIIYEIGLNSLIYEPLFITRVSCNIVKNKCIKKASVRIIQTDDLNYSLIDPYHKPDYKFGNVLGNYGRSTTDTSNLNNINGLGSLYLYTDIDFSIQDIDIEYIKYPNRIWIGTYDLTDNLSPKDVNNTYIYQVGVDTPVTSDLNSHVHNEIVDIAVLITAQLIKDPNFVQLGQQKIINNK